MVFFRAKGKAPCDVQGSLSQSKFKKYPTGTLHCDYYNWDGHISVVCYKLHGYPPDWKAKKITSPGLISGNNGYGRGFGYQNQGFRANHNQFSPKPQYFLNKSGYGSFHAGNSSKSPHAFMTNMQSQ